MAEVKDYLRKHKLPSIWCPGCGDGTIVASIIRAVDALGWDRDDVVMATGIGCSARTNVIVDFNTFQTTHGRVLAFATGFKAVKPEMHVMVVTGDGDGAGIGGNHFIHAARRNIDITTIMINNSIYGMTGGQYSPLSPVGTVASTAVLGTIESPFDVCQLAIAAGATYVARSTVYHVNLTTNLIKEALAHKGFSFVEVISQCPIGYGRRNKMGSPADMLRWQRDNTVNIKAAEKMSAVELQNKILIGELHRRNDRPEFIEQYAQLRETFKRQKGGE